MLTHRAKGTDGLRAFLDFEASSLAKDSYPIEVAWVFEDRRSEAYLIRPIAAWTDWDSRAADIHGISRERLVTEGVPVETVAHRVFDALDGHPVYASSPSWDGKWLSVLLRAGGLPRHALRLKDTDEAQYEAVVERLAPFVQTEQLADVAKTIVERVLAANANQPVAHRALADAAHERELWLAVRAEAAHEGERLAAGKPASTLR